MKYIKKNILLAFASVWLLVCGCEDWLTVEPQNKVVKENFWKTQTDVELVVASTFNKCRDLVDEEFLWGEIRGDFFVPGKQIKDYYLQVMEGNLFPGNDLVKWDNYYKVINQANLVLSNAPLVRDIDLKFEEEELNVIKGQMLFLRSYCLFKLAITFRDIPMPLQAYEFDHQDFMLAQTTQRDVFLQIISDLEMAEAWLPDEYVNENNYQLRKGYPTSLAAKTLMADVYLWLNEPEKTVELCDEVIGSGKLALMGMPLWFGMFKDGESNESIFEIYTNNSIGEGNRSNDAEFSLKKLSSNSKMGSASAQFFAVAQEKYEMFEKDPRGVLRTVALSPDAQWPTLWKWLGESELSPRDYGGGDDKNWIVYRLADIYLMKAEAAIMQGDYATARSSINMIRNRAAINPISVSDDAAKEVWYAALLDEMLLEFAGEGKRWYSLVRVASKEDFAYKNLLIDPIMANVGLDIKVLMKGKISNPDFWYLPIHESELKVNDKLVQNDFYKTN